MGGRRPLPQRARRPAGRRRDLAVPRGARHRYRAALRGRAPTDRPGEAAPGLARPSAAGRADQPPRRRGRRLARTPPGGPPRNDGRDHPRPLVPGRGVHRDLGGRRRHGPPVRGRVRRLRARSGRAGPSVIRARGPAHPVGPQGAGLAAARAARPDVEAEVSHRGGQRTHRRRAGSARRRRAFALRDGAARGQGPGRRGGVAGLRGQAPAPGRDLAAGSWRPRRAGRRQRVRQDHAREAVER